MKAIQCSQCECVKRPGSAHLIISELHFQVGERERGVIAQKSQGPGQQRGVNNDTVVSEMTEVRSFLSVSVGLTGRGSKPDIYLNQPFQNLKDE